jgi:UDP-N-acetylmuramate dehydrogenase
MAGVARFCVRAEMAGLEWAVSVPGTIGGAVVGNAGAHGGEIKDNLAVVRCWRQMGGLWNGLRRNGYAYRKQRIEAKATADAATFRSCSLQHLL